MVWMALRFHAQNWILTKAIYWKYMLENSLINVSMGLVLNELQTRTLALKYWLKHQSWHVVNGHNCFWIPPDPAQPQFEIGSILNSDLVLRSGIHSFRDMVMLWEPVHPLVPRSLPRSLPGKFLGIVGQETSDSKSNRLHVDVFWFCFHSFGVYSCIDSSKMINNSAESLELQLIISQTQPVHL
jgi:hypothetical protein